MKADGETIKVRPCLRCGVATRTTTSWRLCVPCRKHNLMEPEEVELTQERTMLGDGVFRPRERGAT